MFCEPDSDGAQCLNHHSVCQQLELARGVLGLLFWRDLRCVLSSNGSRARNLQASKAQARRSANPRGFSVGWQCGVKATTFPAASSCPWRGMATCQDVARIPGQKPSLSRKQPSSLVAWKVELLGHSSPTLCLRPSHGQMLSSANMQKRALCHVRQCNSALVLSRGHQQRMCQHKDLGPDAGGQRHALLCCPAHRRQPAPLIHGLRKQR